MINFITPPSIYPPSIILPDNIVYYTEDYVLKLKEKLSIYYGIDKNLIFLGNGSSPIIERLINDSSSIYIRKNDFYLYKELAIKMKKNIFIYDNNDFYNAILNNNFLENEFVIFTLVNNFDGELMSFEKIIEMVSFHKKTLFIIDGAYFEYSLLHVNKIKELISFNNVIYLGTFSKAYGLAGLRVGYLLNYNYENLLYSVNNLSSYMAYHLLDEYMSKKKSYLNDILTTTQLELLKFKELGCIINNHKAIYKHNNIDRVMEKLNEKNIIVRKISNNEISMSMNTIENNIILLSILKEINNE